MAFVFKLCDTRIISISLCKSLAKHCINSSLIVEEEIINKTSTIHFFYFLRTIFYVIDTNQYQTHIFMYESMKVSVSLGIGFA